MSRDKKGARLILILWTLIVILLSIFPSSEDPAWQESGVDKVLHFAAYTVFGYFAPFSLSYSIALISGGLLGTITEFLQKYIPGRTGEIFDWLANILGVGVGIFLFNIKRGKR